MGLGVLEPKSGPHVPGTVLLVDNAPHVEDVADLSRTLDKKREGSIILSPQPTDDPNDPLNWTYLEKHLILFSTLLGGIVVAGCPVCHCSLHPKCIPVSNYM